MINNRKKRTNTGFTLIELTILIILSVIISAMGLQLITKQTYVYTKLYQLDSVERTAHNLNNLTLGMIDNWSSSKQTIDGTECVVFSSRDGSHRRHVVLKPTTYNRGDSIGETLQIVAEIRDTTPTGALLGSYPLTDPIIKTLEIDSDISTLRITITDIWDGTAICHSAVN